MKFSELFGLHEDQVKDYLARSAPVSTTRGMEEVSLRLVRVQTPPSGCLDLACHAAGKRGMVLCLEDGMMHLGVEEVLNE